MIYADTDFFIALVKDDDWLQQRATTLATEHAGDIYLTQRESPALSVRRERSDHSRNRTPNRALTNRGAICSHTRNIRFLGTGVNRVRFVSQSSV